MDCQPNGGDSIELVEFANYDSKIGACCLLNSHRVANAAKAFDNVGVHRSRRNSPIVDKLFSHVIITYKI